MNVYHNSLNSAEAAGFTWVRKPGRSKKHCLNEHVCGEVRFLTAPSLEELPGIIHAFSTREGGASTGFLSSMNLGFVREPDPETVRENYRRLGEAVGFDASQVVWTQQTHTINIRRTGKAEWGAGLWHERSYTDIDGLITNEPGTVLTVFMADCVPVLLADPVRRAIGCAHSGWRGTVGNIEREIIGEMQKAYGTDPSDLHAAIGPSICGDCFEVGEEVVDQFRQVYPSESFERLFWRGKEDRWQIDLWEAVRQNLLCSGVREENISVTDICTKCNPSRLFSHRAHGLARGTLAGFIAIK